MAEAFIGEGRISREILPRRACRADGARDKTHAYPALKRGASDCRPQAGWGVGGGCGVLGVRDVVRGDRDFRSWQKCHVSLSQGYVRHRSWYPLPTKAPHLPKEGRYGPRNLWATGPRDRDFGVLGKAPHIPKPGRCAPPALCPLPTKTPTQGRPPRRTTLNGAPS